MKKITLEQLDTKARGVASFYMVHEFDEATGRVRVPLLEECSEDFRRLYHETRKSLLKSAQ